MMMGRSAPMIFSAVLTVQKTEPQRSTETRLNYCSKSSGESSHPWGWWVNSSLLKDFITTDVRATYSHWVLWWRVYLGTGWSWSVWNSSSDLLKIWQEGGAPSGPCPSIIFCLWKSRHASSPQIQLGAGKSVGRGDDWEVEFVVWCLKWSGWGVWRWVNKTHSKTHSGHQPVDGSPQCWGMVSCSWWCPAELFTLAAITCVFFHSDWNYTNLRFRVSCFHVMWVNMVRCLHVLTHLIRTAVWHAQNWWMCHAFLFLHGCLISSAHIWSRELEKGTSSCIYIKTCS